MTATALPGAVRASCGLATKQADLDHFLRALAVVAGSPPPVRYEMDPVTGDYWPRGFDRPDAALGSRAGCSRS